jgi:DNA repair exonuclease SbcCD ATPase subunit
MTVETKEQLEAKLVALQNELNQRDPSIIEQKLAALQAELAKRDQIITEQNQKLQDLHAKNEGWLITTPNPLYDGVVWGITFVRGQAFIRKDQDVAAFHVTPMKESQIKVYPAEEQAAIREREKISSAERAVKVLVNDFGYEAQYFDADHLAERDALINKRVMERNQAEIAAREAEKIRAMSSSAMGR